VLGNGTTADQSSPVVVNAPAPGVTFTQLTAGSFHTCGLGSDTKAYCWGQAAEGVLGNGDTTNQSSPVAVNAPPGVTFTHLTAGGLNTCGLDSDGKAYCWGYGSTGGLGNGDTAHRSSPVAVNAPAPAVTFTQLATGNGYTCGLGSDTKAYCWGFNGNGQLGNGDTTNRSRPVAVNAPPGVTFRQLAPSGWHTCGLGSDSNAYCWGWGSSGQLGNGDNTEQLSPVAVNAPTPRVTFTQLATGNSHTCGLGSDTKAYCWGAGSGGGLGNGSTADQSTPVAVSPFPQTVGP
jgi:alpha-tubulin suppressor-like RCC1 family protein